MKTWYRFAKGNAEGDQSMRDVLGGKGANLAEMCRLGAPVPPGFTLPTYLCARYYEDGAQLSPEVCQGLRDGMAHVEAHLNGVRFGDADKPLLVSVRSGARVSMPGMMDTVLNIGLTQTTVEGLAKSSGSRRFALDSFRRLIQMYGDVVAGVGHGDLEAPLKEMRRQRGVKFDNELSADDLQQIIDAQLTIYAEAVGRPFPQDPWVQLEGAVAAVFGSWRGRRAETYRALNNIPETWGTAANVQAMVFGNFGATSATGVAFSRDPATGGSTPLGEWLPNAQGEDVVAGIRTPGPLHAAENDGSGVGALQDAMPEVYKDLLEVMQRLELHYREMQDVEFTVQEGQLFLLQTRNGKRTAQAALRIASDMVREGLINQEEAVLRVEPAQVNQLMHPQLDPSAEKETLIKGLPASPGAVSGTIVLDADAAETLAAQGERVILIRQDTSPEDIHGMHAAAGVLTQTGGMTSHAAVVARGMGRTCIVGCSGLSIDENDGVVRFEHEGQVHVLKRGDTITLDGASGSVYAGAVPTVAADLGGDFGTFMGWADAVRHMKVRTNADTPHDAAAARRLGAEGIGLCRTEHMFFAPERLLPMREMILASDAVERQHALDKLEPFQREDFVGIFTAMDGYPVTVRLLDPPLHEFLPHGDEDLTPIAADLNIDVNELRRKRDALVEFNPMLGHRGCRLGITFPAIYQMQVRAIMQAACDAHERGCTVMPEIMIPLVMEPAELERLRAEAVAVADAVLAERRVSIGYMVGTMIELPRAALLADEVAAHADFFSYGTNDLTQTTMGLSRDDAGRFLPAYLNNGMLPADPFQSVDQRGVGKLVEMGVKLGRSVQAGLKIGVCGEQGGDPASIGFFASVGVDYVSCSPYRVPVARLAAAQVAVRNKRAAV